MTSHEILGGPPNQIGLARKALVHPGLVGASRQSLRSAFSLLIRNPKLGNGVENGVCHKSPMT